jgi:hypothetical protein
MKNKFHFTRQFWAAIFVVTIFCSTRLLAQTNSEATNEPLKLLPPLGELTPTFWEQNASVISFSGLGVVALLAFFLWLFFRPKPKNIVPPEIQAREALHKLSAQPEGGARLSRISQVVRQYFIAAFQLAPGEFTTAEFSRLVTSQESIGAELAAATTKFLRDCDARKFSAAGANTTLNAADLALNLIESAETRRSQLTSNQGGRA